MRCRCPKAETIREKSDRISTREQRAGALPRSLVNVTQHVFILTAVYGSTHGYLFMQLFFCRLRHLAHEAIPRPCQWRRETHQPAGSVLRALRIKVVLTLRQSNAQAHTGIVFLYWDGKARTNAVGDGGCTIKHGSRR